VIILLKRSPTRRTTELARSHRSPVQTQPPLLTATDRDPHDLSLPREKKKKKEKKRTDDDLVVRFFL